jgi:hypothetical protein
MNDREEAFLYHTINDAYDLITQYGFDNMVLMLFKEMKGRVLTIEELEAMQVLHDGWNL